MGLTEYKRKRKFSKTPEPKGRVEPAGGPLHFVIQKHDASHLHYDLRLEIDGVLKSWAIPKGPSMNPADKRLAMMVEDHPLEYGSFEGVIPKGNYGAGTVMVWDEGVYTSLDGGGDTAQAEKNLRSGLAKGDLKIVMYGHKIKGAFGLVKMKDDDNSWLLIKKNDEYANTQDVTKLDQSVRTQRKIAQIEGSSKQWLREPELDLGDAPEANQPESIRPMLATLASEPFDRAGWLFEVKWDGYRILAHIKDREVRLQSRGNKDYTKVFETIARELSDLKIDCILDGEMVVIDGEGRSNFGALQNYQRTGKGQLVYYVFDVTHAAGRDLRQLPLVQRKQIASDIIKPLKDVQYSDHVEEKGIAFFRVAGQKRLEGIIAKAADSSYVEGERGRNWLKIKTHQRQEAVIGGWTEPKGGRKYFGSLILGVYDSSGKLQPIGSSGGGFSSNELEYIYGKLKRIERKTSPFVVQPKTLGKPHWVSPKLLAEVSFSEWTDDGQMRHPVFEGLREDKEALQVKKEVPQDISGDQLEIKHRDKVFWPREGYTKGDLIDYYDQISEIILPYLADRPESMNRFPDGIEGNSFFQKDLENHPGWVRTEPIYSESNDKDINWMICNDQESLFYMINLGCIELNPWHSKLGSLDNPDWCLIDLDAKTCTFESVIRVAQETHRLLEELGVKSLAKTSGKTGLHICIPLGAKYTYEQSRQFAQILVNKVNERLPELTSVDRTPKKREGKIYLDYLQNRAGQTMAAPYCVRPVPRATVSTPLKWAEVRKGLDPTKFTIKTTVKRIDKTGDLWRSVMGMGIDMKDVLSKLG